MTSLFRHQLLRLRWIILALAVAMVIGIFTMIQPSQALLGAYDPKQRFQGPAIVLDHHFVTWRPDHANELTAALQQAQKRQRIPMISLEPWPWNAYGMNRATLLQDILAGRYNETLDRALRTIQAAAPDRVLLRWAHEMEIVGQYPWSVADAQSYVAAYRYIHQRAQQLGIHNLIWIWSPAGNRNALEYWPGTDVVDMVGISIYATPEWHPDRSGTLPSFQRLMTDKYRLVEPLHKPILVAEVGVNAAAREQQQWLAEAIQHLAQFPRLIGWVYFNQIQPEVVPLPIGTPNWSLQSGPLEYLVQHWPYRRPQTPAQKQLQDILTRQTGVDRS
jgi:beta-mannanase